MIDTHVHLIDPRRFPFPPGSEGYVPKRDETGTLEQLLDVMAANGVSKAILVAASVYGADNASMIAAATVHPDRLGIVASPDPDDDASVERVAALPGVVGIRFNLKDDKRFRDDPDKVKRLLRGATDAGLAVCLLGPPSAVLHILGENDRARVVLDHMGRPDLDGGLPALRELSRRPNTWLKLSGGFRISRGPDWTHPGSKLSQVVEAFPANRLLWGSDWPFINLGGAPRPSYQDCLAWGRALSGADFAANAQSLFWSRT
ncbi:MAG: amidohydrolase family protein [Rhodobiaceae bacterium]|nr:amidohydrolase family protein [Rhodobiaceae bacterium]MCC0049749.1 amidohydrolase family protein [Rhodobiaceae bacterium]